jgi:ubiquinone biosynthesis protein
VAFSTLFTMLTAVTIDLVARPGSLARGDEAGLIVLGNPVRDLRRWIAPLHRYREVVAIARRNGLVTAGRARSGSGRRSGRGLNAVALRHTLEQAGVVFVKFGQMASTRDDMVPVDLRSELALLQTHVDPTPQEAMQEQLETELGDVLERHFSAFDWHPLGSASIAQAYAATLITGEEVVVKIQRPGIEELVERDSVALLRLASFLERRTPQGRQLRIEQLAGEFTRALRQELDFSLEAREALEIARITGRTAGVRIPQIYDELSTSRVLIQERFNGFSVADSAGIARMGLDAAELADRLVQTMTKHMLTDGHFHADPHPGNVLLLDNGDLGLIDFGATGRIDPPQRTALIEMTIAVLRGDASALREGIEQITVIRPETSEVALERALQRFMTDNLRSGVVNITAFGDLMTLLATFKIDIPAELTTFFRTLALLDGTVRTIHPGYSLIDGMQRLFDPRAAVATGAMSRKDQLLDLVLRDAPRLQRLPARIDRITKLAAQGQLRVKVSLLSTEQDVVVVTRLLNRLLLGIIGSGLGLASAVLVATGSGTSNGPHALPAVLGYLGLSIAAVLILRVVATIVRDGYN